MGVEPIVSVSHELIFQILNTTIILLGIVLILFAIYSFMKKIKIRDEYENKIIELEDIVKELEDKIYKIEKMETKRVSFEKFIGKKVVEINGFLPVFTFNEGEYLRIECSWRLRNKKIIILGEAEYKSESTHDEYHKKLLELLLNQEIKDIKLNPIISDLSIYFSNDLLLEIFCNSSYYENWELGDKDDTFLISFPGGSLD